MYTLYDNIMYSVYIPYRQYSELKIRLLEYQKILPCKKHNVLRVHQYPQPTPNMYVSPLVNMSMVVEICLWDTLEGMIISIPCED